jgi:phosphoribosylaminoimidazole carboxylase PurE protein
MNQIQVGIVMGSDSDWPLVKKACETLDKFGVAYETRVISAHRTPDVALEYSKTAEARGLKVIIAAAGGAEFVASDEAEKSRKKGLLFCPAARIMRHEQTRAALFGKNRFLSIGTERPAKSLI